MKYVPAALIDLDLARLPVLLCLLRQTKGVSEKNFLFAHLNEDRGETGKPLTKGFDCLAKVVLAIPSGRLLEPAKADHGVARDAIGALAAEPRNWRYQRDACRRRQAGGPDTQRKFESDMPAGGIAGEDNAAFSIAALHQGFIGRQCIFGSCWPRMLRRETIVRNDNLHPRLNRQTACNAAMGSGTAETESAAMEIQYDPRALAARR